MAYRKPRVGIFSLSSCEGCLVQLFSIEDRILDILGSVELAECRLLGVEDCGTLDVAIVEGAVTSKEEEERLIEIRKKSKILIAFGDCACHGGRFLVKDFDREIDANLPRVGKFKSEPLDKYVEVEYHVYGCPVSREEILELFKDLLLGRPHRPKSYNVCAECILRENDCLLDHGVACMGPITRGGCRAICPTFKRECIGCRGLSEDANIEALITVFKEKGIEIPEYLPLLKKYVGSETL
ncbi:MAG: NADH:ubiquinone oxidoreductase [Thermoprotei archaeon]|nr:MAG: NADH:ubiquinone oxidoreductase [Thermoprotei archaeon]